MANNIESKLQGLGSEIPNAPNSGGSYIPYVIVDSLVFISGQLPRTGGKVAYPGKLGGGLSIEDGKSAARICALNLLAQLKAAVSGDLDRVVRCVRLTGFVNSDPQFTEQPQVVNGASDLMIAIFGEYGQHARTAVGVASLPAGAPVEVEGIFQISTPLI